MKKAVFSLIAVLLVAASAQAQTSIVASKHDLTTLSAANASAAPFSGQVCVYCHTPHAKSTTPYLWNKTVKAATDYGLTYINQGASATCLSCHDGTVGVDAVLNIGGVAGNWTANGTGDYTADWKMAATNPAFIGTDLSNDHPIGEVYPIAGTANRMKAAVNTNYYTYYLVNGSDKIPVFAKTGTTDYTVECSSCHTPHNPSKGFFLRTQNTGSGLCLACHIK